MVKITIEIVLKGDWGKKRKSFNKVILRKRTQENEGVNIVFFALLMGEVYDFTTVNLISLQAGSY